ncbi:PCID2-like protein [Mya arenaria]|uniref:CSN12-like protein n=1 Tax=Mya arenaria TaxID=6604 RepID=A0ABY7FYV5_MYAAR|nr:PCID2-like protein [Mya arenaria]
MAFNDKLFDNLQQYDGEKSGELLAFTHPHVANAKLQLENPENLVQRVFEPPWDDVSQKDENWSLPILFAICLDLRLFANKADHQTVQRGRGKYGERLEKAAETLMGCFRVCASDNRASIEDTKKWGMLNLVNQLFKIYFKINKLPLCKPLIRAIDSLPMKDRFSLAHLITFRYYVGQKAMFDGDFKKADEYLTSGNIRQLNEVMEKHELYFIKCGIYLILEKLKIIAYRNLFKKVYLIKKTHQIPVQSFTRALQWMEVDQIDNDETACIIANLICDSKIKGYISYQHQKVVVSKQNPFPQLSTVI